MRPLVKSCLRIYSAHHKKHTVSYKTENVQDRSLYCFTLKGELRPDALPERRRVPTLTENRPIGNSIKLNVESRDG